MANSVLPGEDACTHAHHAHPHCPALRGCPCTMHTHTPFCPHTCAPCTPTLRAPLHAPRGNLPSESSSSHALTLQEAASLLLWKCSALTGTAKHPHQGPALTQAFQVSSTTQTVGLMRRDSWGPDLHRSQINLTSRSQGQNISFTSTSKVYR